MIPKRHKYKGFSTIQSEERPTATRLFVESNTHKNITLRAEYMYIEDAKTAININTLEKRIKLKRWLIRQLQSIQIDETYANSPLERGKTQSVRGVSLLIQSLFDSSDKDRHTLQKRFRITL